MTIAEVVIELNKSSFIGFQLSSRNGILNSTWVVYLFKDDYYYFDINEDFVFDEIHRYSYEELLNEFGDKHYLSCLLFPNSSMRNSFAMKQTYTYCMRRSIYNMYHAFKYLLWWDCYLFPSFIQSHQ